MANREQFEYNRKSKKEIKNIFEYHKKKVEKLPLNKWLKQFE